jgi:hypothetical protein
MPYSKGGDWIENIGWNYVLRHLNYGARYINGVGKRVAHPTDLCCKASVVRALIRNHMNIVKHQEEQYAILYSHQLHGRTSSIAGIWIWGGWSDCSSSSLIAEGWASCNRE